MSSSSNTKMVEGGRVAVIGAGVAGVATATALKKAGLPFCVYEKQNGIGGLWYQNYPGASVQTTPEQYEYPGKKYPEHIRTRTNPPTPTAAEVKDYLNEWCDEHDISENFEFGVTVHNITKKQNGDWVVESTKGSETFSYVVICTGLFSNTPNILDIPGLDDFKKAGGVVEHTSTWTSEDDFKDKKVLVIGNGKSAADAAVVAARMAKLHGGTPPLQCIRKQNWYVPRFMLNFKWAFHSRVVSALLPRYFENNGMMEMILHALFSPIKFLLWRLLELIFLALLRLPYKVWPRFGTLDTEGSLSVPLLVTDDRHLIPIRKGEIDMRICQVVKLEPGKAHLNTGEVVDVDMVVMGTGWKLDYSFLDETTVRSKLSLGEDGLWLYRNILAPDVPGLAFVGANCLTFMNMYTSFVQAHWLVGLMVDENREYPTVKHMNQTIAREQAFKRSLYPLCPIRGATIEAFMQHYHDILIRETGINPHVYDGQLFGAVKNVLWPLMPETMADSYAAKDAARKKND